MKIFLTHIGEEAGLAAVLKRWIEDTFPGKCEVFVSSDSDDIVPGDKWLLITVEGQTLRKEERRGGSG